MKICANEWAWFFGSSAYKNNGEWVGTYLNEATEKVFEPEYFGDLSANNKMIIYFNGKYCEANKLNCYKD